MTTNILEINNLENIYKIWFEKINIKVETIKNTSKNKIIHFEKQSLELLIELILDKIFENEKYKKYNIISDDKMIIIKCQNTRNIYMDEWHKKIEESLSQFLYKKSQSQNVNKIYTKTNNLEFMWENTIIIDDKKSYLPTRTIKRKKRKIPSKDSQIPFGQGYYFPDSE